jgi:glycine betaine catabolism B
MLKIKIIDPQTPTKNRQEQFQLEVTNKDCLIGRNPNCELQMEADEVSRMHGKFFYQNSQYYFQDLASSGGSSLNSNPVEPRQDYVVNSGDHIQIGRYILIVVEAGSSSQATKLPPNNKVLENTLIDLNKNKNGNSENKTTTSLQQEAPSSTNTTPQYMPVALVEPTQLQRWTKGEISVTCSEVIDETHDVKTFRFVAATPLLFTYKPGQFVGLNLEINGNEVSRSYSISSTPSRPHTLEITVKRVPGGLVSNWLHDNIKVNSRINIDGPFGKFTCFTKPSQKLLFISGGSGITPMMSMSRWLLDTVANVDIVFFHCARSPRDIIYRHELELMSARYANFHLAISTTNYEPGYHWSGFKGRLNTTMLELIASDFRDRTVYVCGPESFMESAKQTLATLGFPMQNYYEESFGPPRKKIQEKQPQEQQKEYDKKVNAFSLKQILFDSQVLEASPAHQLTNYVKQTSPVQPFAPSQNSSLAVVFKKSGKEIPCDGEESILAIAEQEGIKIRSSCRAGACGSCKKRKLEGDVKSDGTPEGLEESEINEGYILTCISYPLGKVVIDA